jgi:hypothetical protein
MSKEMEYKLFIEEFKGNPIFAIWKIDKEGNKVNPSPMISFGKNKAKELLKYYEELKQFVGEENDQA